MADALAEWQQSIGARISLQADLTWSGGQDGYVQAGWADSAVNPYGALWWDLEPTAQHCFPAGTMVTTPDGERPIETLEVGDLVETLSGPRRVTRLWRKMYAGPMVRVAAQGRTVECTPNHPFLTQRGWVAAGELCGSDQVVLAQDSGDFLAAHLRLPDANDRVATGRQVRVLRPVALLLRKLALRQRRKARMAVPVVPVSLNDQRVNADVHNEFVLDHGRRLKVNQQVAQDSAEPLFEFAGLVTLQPLMARQQFGVQCRSFLRMLRKPRLPLRQTLRIAHRVMARHVRARSIMDNAARCGRREIQSQAHGLVSHLAMGQSQRRRHAFSALSCVVLAQILNLLRRPFARFALRQIAAARTQFLFALSVVAARWADLELLRASQPALSHVAITTHHTTESSHRRATPMFLEHLSTLFTNVLCRHSATPRFLTTSVTRPTTVYNLSVLQVEHYFANGFVVHNCSDCPALAAASPYDPPWINGGNTLTVAPGDGATECGAGCRCSLRYGPGREVGSYAPMPGQPAEIVPPSAAGGGVGAGVDEEQAPFVVTPATGESAFAVARRQEFVQPTAEDIAALPEVARPVHDLNEGEQRAMDSYRQAVAMWNYYRAALPPLPMFWQMLARSADDPPLWDWDTLTGGQKRALRLLQKAISQWYASSPDIDLYDDLREPEDGAYRLYNPYPRQKGGRFGFGPGKVGGSSGSGTAHGRGANGATSRENKGAGKAKGGGGSAGSGEQSHKAFTTKSWLERYTKDQEPSIEEMARHHGMSVDAYKAHIEGRLRTMLKGSSVYTRRSDQAAENIINEGGFKTQHETGTSKGDIDIAGRTRLEQRMFGETGALYGYAAKSGTGQHTLNSYGDVVFELKASKLADATVTFGDTYELTVAGGIGRVAPSPFRAPTYHSWMFNSGHGWSHEPADYHSSLAHYTHTGEFAEVQIHGGLRLRDIKSVWFTGARPSEATLERLRQLKIPYHLRDGSQ